MKSLLFKLIAATLTTTVLSACGSALPIGQLRQPARAMQSRNVQARNLQTRNVQAQYMNLILATSYSPDQNGMQFGFDFGNVRYIDFQARQVELDLRYSAKGRILWINLASEGQNEHVDQTNKARLAEVASELRHLGAGTPADKANIQRIAALLENPPVRP